MTTRTEAIERLLAVIGAAGDCHELATIGKPKSTSSGRSIKPKTSS